MEHNVTRLHACGQPVATIKAVHSGVNASKASSDDASGLEPVVCLAKGARVMLSSNLWIEMGLVNGATGTVQAICYKQGQAPPSLPVAVTVLFLVPLYLMVQYQSHHYVGLGHLLVLPASAYSYH